MQESPEVMLWWLRHPQEMKGSIEVPVQNDEIHRRHLWLFAPTSGVNFHLYL